jgi:hypothetical protein
MSSKKRNPTTVDIIAKRFKVKPSYVRSILKIGRVKPINFRRMRAGRMSVFQAYNDAKKEEKGIIPDVPEVKPIVYYHTVSHSPEEFNYSTKLEAVDSENVSTTNADVWFTSDGESNTLVDGGKPTSDLKQVKANPTKKMIEKEESKDKKLVRLDEDRIQFNCPCGCNKKFIINHKKLTYESK